MSAVDWYFDFISPFAYLQWQRLRREQPALQLRPVPVLLAALLQHWGTLGPAEVPSKRRCTYRFVLWQARQQGIALRFPPAHPFNPLPALRLAIAAGNNPDAINAVFDHLWRDGRAGDSADALRGLARDLGIADIDTALADPAVKAQLAANGQAAIAADVFGVPTLAIDGELFWGVDATDMALAYRADPAAVLDAPMRALDALPIGITRPR